MVRTAAFIATMALGLALPVAAADTAAPAEKSMIEKTKDDSRKTALTPEEVKASKAKGKAPMSAADKDRVEKTQSEARKTALTKEEVKASKAKPRAKVDPKEVEEAKKKSGGN
jgi:hypothetical protein